MSRKLAFLIAVTIAVYIFVFGVIFRNRALLSGNLTPLAGWTTDYVESRWGKVKSVTGAFGEQHDFGWDLTGRYYAVPHDDQQHEVLIVDRVEQRTCSLPVIGFNEEGWINGGTESSAYPAYHVRDWSNHGMDLRYELNLNTWIITTSIYGDHCLEMQCGKHDPPWVSTHDCESTHLVPSLN
jgi:hypothetical protein